MGGRKRTKRWRDGGREEISSRRSDGEKGDRNYFLYVLEFRTYQHEFTNSAQYCEAGTRQQLETDGTQPLHKPQHTLQ